MDDKKINYYLDELYEIIDDVNVAEIYSQMSLGELKEWCKLWQAAANACLKKIKEAL